MNAIAVTQCELQHVDEFFTKIIRVTVERNSLGRDYLQMRLHSKIGALFQDVPMNKRGLKRCQQIAETLGFELFIQPQALEMMNAHE